MATAQTLSSTSPTGPKLLYSYSTNASYPYLTEIDSKDGSTTISNAIVHLYWHVLDSTDCGTGYVLCIVGPDNVKWYYSADGSGNLQTVNDGYRDLFKVTYSSGLPQYLYDANELVSGSDKITFGYASSQVTSIAYGPITNQTPSTSTWSFAYTSPTYCSGGSPPSDCKTDGVKSAHPGLSVNQQRVAAGYTVMKSPCQQSSVSCPGQTDSSSSKVYYDGNDLIMEQVGPLGSGDYTQEQFNSNGPSLDRGSKLDRRPGQLHIRLAQ